MRQWTRREKFRFLLPIFCFLPFIAFAEIAGETPGEYVGSFYKFSLLISGVLAFGAIVYGGIIYAFAAGNPSKQSEGKEWVKGAIWGLLLLGGAYLILKTINPSIVGLSLEKLPALPSGPGPAASSTPETLKNCVPTSAGSGTCKNCVESPALVKAENCLRALNPKLYGGITVTFAGQHACNAETGSTSCHFGGRNCDDGAHAFDVGKNALRSNGGLTVLEAAEMIRGSGCPGITTVRCEFGSATADCRSADHVHVNVANESCGCN